MVSRASDGREAGAVAAIVPAAGRPARGRFAPAWAALAGRPAWAWPVDVLDAAGVVGVVALVVAPRRLAEAARLAAEAGWRRVRVLCAARGDPAAQLAAALAGLEARYETLVVHDPACPLLAPRTLDAALAATDGVRLVAAGVPVKETLKLVDRAGQVRRTPPRADLWALRAPIVLPRHALDADVARWPAPDAGGAGGLAAWLLAACAGRPLRVVPAEDDAVLRHPADVVAAEALLRARTAPAR